MPSAGQELLVLSKAAHEQTRSSNIQKYFHFVFVPIKMLFKTIFML